MNVVSERPNPDFGAEMRKYAAAGFLEHIVPIIPPNATISSFAGNNIPGAR